MEIFMREIDVSLVRDTVERLCISSNIHLPKDVRCALDSARDAEGEGLASSVLSSIIENYKIAEDEAMPICQDTGMACVFLEIGQDVHFIGGSLYDAINEGVRRGYARGYLRKSVVADPIRRGNTSDNTPAVIYTDVVDGDKVKITFSPKGFGSENMSAICMLKPSDSLEGVKKFIIETVKKAGSNPCPPIVVGVGIGGTFDRAALLAKKALLRSVDTKNPDPYYSALEDELLSSINALGIGPQGFGGVTTALGVNIEVFPTHIAGLPVAVNVGCHVTRHESEVL